MEKSNIGYVFLALAFVLVSSNTFPVFQGVKAQGAVPAWDFEDNGYTHSSFTTMSASQISSELTAMDQLFLSHNLPTPRHIIYPYGGYSSQVVSTASQYRSTGQLYNEGSPFPTTYPVPNWHALPSRYLTSSTSYSQVKSWVDTAVAQKGLITLCTHQVTTSFTDALTPTLLGQVLDYIVAQKNAGSLQVLTMRQAYAQFNGQKAAVVIAFDDGYATDYTTVYPMFKSRGIAGTSFIVGNTISSNDASRLTWGMIAEMAQVSTTPPPGWSISVSSSPAGSGTTSVAGTVSVAQGNSLTVSATPAANYIWSNWILDGKNYYSSDSIYAQVNSLTKSITVPAQAAGSSHTLVAVFKYAPYVLTVDKTGGGMINIWIAGSPIGGATGGYRIASGTSATVTVYKSPGPYRLDHWTLDGASYATTLPTFTMNANHNVMAYFVPNYHTLAITCTDGGYTSSSGTNQYTVQEPDSPYDTVVSVTAYAYKDYRFDHWTLNGQTSTANPITVKMNAGIIGTTYNLKAFFTYVPPVTAPPITAPPITAPPITAPPVTAPPITAPPVTAPPVTAPPVTAPPTTAPPTTAPPTTAPPTTAPPTTVPPTPTATVPPTTAPTETPTEKPTPTNPPTSTPTCSPTSSPTQSAEPTQETTTTTAASPTATSAPTVTATATPAQVQTLPSGAPSADANKEQDTSQITSLTIFVLIAAVVGLTATITIFALRRTNGKKVKQTTL